MQNKIVFLILIIISFVFSCTRSENSEPYMEHGVTIYYKVDFNKTKDRFHGSKGVTQRLVIDSISGGALLTLCKTKWSGPMLPVDIKGSKGLKIAFMAKGRNYKSATLNMYDLTSKDNTTPYGYRFLPDNNWVPVLYYVDLFRYNSMNSGFIKQETHFKNIRFWGPQPYSDDISITLDNFVVYRGEDVVAPEKVVEVKAVAKKNGIKLTWKIPHDNVFPMVYVVSRAEEKGNFKKIAETFKPSYLDKTAENKIYYYRVLACDFQNNLGQWSDILKVKGISRYSNKLTNELEEDRKHYSNHIKEVHQLGRGYVEKGMVVMYGDSLTGPTLYKRLVAGALGIYKVKAYGYSGMKIQWGKGNLEKRVLKEVIPEFMLLMFGTNDVKGRKRSSKTYEIWAKDLVETAKLAQSRGIVVILGTIPPRGFDDPKSLPEYEFNKILIKQAKKNNIPLAYVFNDIQKSGNREKFIWKDGIHWTAQGMEVAAKAWAKTFRQIEFVLRDRP